MPFFNARYDALVEREVKRRKGLTNWAEFNLEPPLAEWKPIIDGGALMRIPGEPLFALMTPNQINEIKAGSHTVAVQICLLTVLFDGNKMEWNETYFEVCTVRNDHVLEWLSQQSRYRKALK